MDWREGFSEEVIAWAIQRIKEEINKGYDYADSYRIANPCSPSQMDKFAKLRTCCGRCEFSETGPDGIEYLLGFNHGH